MQIVCKRKTIITYALTIFSGTWLEAVPFLVLGILISTIISVFVPEGFLQRVFPKHLVPGLLFGVLGGFFLPVCDCASVPVFRSLIRKGIPVSAAVTFMTAAPIINPVAVLSTWYAYGGNLRMVAARVCFGILCALLTGLFFSFRNRYDFRDAPSTSCCTCSEDDHCGENLNFLGKFAEVLHHSMEEFFEVGVWQISGIAVATVFQVWINGTDAITRLLSFSGKTGNILTILCMMGLAFCLSLCSSSDAVICKVIGKGLSPIPQLAFLVFGPMMDIKNVVLLSGMCSPRFAARAAITTFVVCFLVMTVLSFSGLGSFLQ